MKILVIGGTGLIGSKTVAHLREHGHEVNAASPATGVNTITGEGLDAAMAGTDVVIDVANSPSFEDQAVLDFFETSGRNLFSAEHKAGVKHHVALSVVGTDRLAASGYFRGKIAQEKLIRESGVPYTIIHSTQFFEFLNGIVKASAIGESIHLSTASIQPISSDDVAKAVAKLSVSAPVNGTVEIAGPETFPLSGLVQQLLKVIGDPRDVVADEHTPYFGAELQQDTLLPGPGAHLGTLNFQAWLERTGLVGAEARP
ncbi:NmrA family transcriptional regulator [Rhodanobacter sp. Root179]|uniref:SDR family oxidoreductase n=1 Tax=Rhodanobacter sp. Root179 TaxID=1736482 RepID=UPI0006FCDAD0|nr:SDR family oxidoreductase [Rhodanobacter sp. Root179]KRB33809.1 NmrA family transcriptional regulator [Rhodanobacter sp. Root179]